MRVIGWLMIILFILISSIAYSQSWEGLDYYLYYGHTGKETTVKWSDPKVTTPTDTTDDYNALTDKFELIVYNKDRDYSVDLASIPADVFEYTFKLPKIGHWIPKIRVKRTLLVDGVESIAYTEWTESIDATVSKVNGVDRGWWLFTWLAPVGPIE